MEKAEKYLEAKEIKDLNFLVKETNEFLAKLGELEFKYLTEKSNILKKLEEIQINQNTLGNMLSYKYGDGEIDLERGVIVSKLQEKTNIY